MATGLAAIPLLLVKLWTVYPKLFEWPPAGSVSRVISRLSILVLVGACAMQLLTGLINIAAWYPSDLLLPDRALLDRLGGDRRHRRAHRRKGPGDPPRPGPPGHPSAAAGLTEEQATERAAVDDAAEQQAVSRRAFVLAAGLGVGAVTLTTVGQTFSPLGAVSVLSPRIPGVGPQGVPVRQTARAARVTDVGPEYRLVIDGPNRLELTLDELTGVPAAHRAPADLLRRGLERQRDLDRRAAR